MATQPLLRGVAFNECHEPIFHSPTCVSARIDLNQREVLFHVESETISLKIVAKKDDMR